MKRRFFAILTILSMFSLCITAQDVRQVKDDPDIAAQELIIKKNKVVSLVEKTAEEASFYEDKKTGIEVLIASADLLWPEGGSQPEKWLLRAWGQIDEIDEPQRDERMREFFTRSDRSRLRTSVLDVAFRHDRDLAAKLLEQLAKKKDEEKRDGEGAFDNRTERSEHLLQLALRVIPTNPELAVHLAESSLIDGISFSLQAVLSELRRANAGLSNQLFDSALGRFTNSNSSVSEAQVLAGYLFTPGMTFAINSSGQVILAVNPNQRSLPPVAQDEPVRARNFLTASHQMFFTRPDLLNIPGDSGHAASVLEFGRQILGYYPQYAPELYPFVTGFLRMLEERISPSSRPSGASDTDAHRKNATPEEIYDAMIKRLEKIADEENDPIAKKLAYVRAALATKASDYKRGENIAKKISDDLLMEDVISFLLYRAALHFAEENEIDTADEIAARIKEPLRRSTANLVIGQALLALTETEKDDLEPERVEMIKQRAFDRLDQVERELRNDNSTNAIKALFGASYLAGKFEPWRGVSFLSQSIEKINKVQAFEIKDNSAPRLGLEVSSVSGATVALPKLGFGLRSSLMILIDSEFDQVSSQIERIGSKDIRGKARLELATVFFHKHQRELNEIMAK